MAVAQFRDRVTPRHVGALGIMVLGAAAWAMPALAQPETPAHDGNRWGGINHQPTRAAVATQEHRAGIALTDTQKREADAELRRLGRDDLRNAGGASQ